ncbi:MAG: tRNA epoxyqueuosine(34) reductase QueG [Gemmatimonadales bacterium]|nr:MAG: tRNA epoxyqueuosine(34) reductase QueG [Gemmatimonadales bacterium]
MSAEPRHPDGRREVLLEWAREEGFDRVGVATPEPSEQAAFLERWVDEGYHGEMEYLARPDALERRGDPSRNLEGLRSILVVGHDYAQPDPEGVPDDPARGVIARYARGRDYHRVMKKALERILRRLEAYEGRSIAGRAYVDTGPLLERELGRRAGLGWFGRNTMLIDPKGGSYFFLGALLLPVEVTPDAPFTADRCGSCRACLVACPTGALLGRDEDGAPVMDARRCISYLTIENPGPIPRELRPLMGNRVYGCDICQEVCPFPRKFSEPSTEPSYAARGPGDRPVGVEPDPSAPDAPHPGTDAPPLVELLSMALSEESWASFSRGSAIRRAGRSGFARNVSVSLGNWLSEEEDPSPEALSVLMEALSDPVALVRGHAAWALGCVGSVEVVEVLSTALEEEDDDFVLGELELAIARCLPSPK